MIAVSQQRTKRLIKIHGWSGTILGLLLYAVVLTGTVVVFSHEIGIWSQGVGGQEVGIKGSIDHPIRKMARKVDPKYLDEVSIFQDSRGDLGAFFHTHEKNPKTGTLEDLGIDVRFSAANGEVLQTIEGFRSEMEDPMSVLEDFLVDLHVQLYVPEPWGLILTGILGLSMMVAAVSGFIIHRHLLRDIFLPSRGGNRLVSSRDRHILAGAWGLPFAFVLAFTGAFFSFAISIGLPVVSMVAFGGDQEAMIETLIGVPATNEAKSEPLASLDYIIRDSVKRSGSDPTFISVTRYGTSSAKVFVNHPAADGALSGITQMYDGPTRKYLGIKPFIGTEPSVGNTAVSLIGPLHFGNFAGLISKTAWVALGGAMAYVIVTGMRLWTKRREEETAWQPFDRAITVVVWGLPIAMAGSALFFFLSVPAGNTGWWTPFGFAASAFLMIAVGIVKKAPHRLFRKILAYTVLSLPVVRHLTGGTSWGEALVDGQSIILSADFLLLLGGATLLYRPKIFANTQSMILEPVE